MKTITLTFEGYWSDSKKSFVPSQSGIYCVYPGTLNSTNNTVSLRAPIYIGESENVCERLRNHERISDWKKHLKPGETLWYSFAPVIYENDRFRAEAALIYYHKPVCNSEYITSFPFSSTEIITKGANYGLSEKFTIVNNY